MDKSRFVLLLPFFMACVALGLLAPPEIALPIAVVIFIISTGFYRKQQQQKKAPKEESKDL